MTTAAIATTDNDVVIYDGYCKLCTAGVSRLRWFDWFRHFRYQSLHAPEIAENYPDLSHDMLMAEMYVVDKEGNRYAGANAFRYMSWRIPVLWPLAPLLSLPGTMGIWSRLYKLVANNRYRFGRLSDCDGGTCHLHFGPKTSVADQAKN